MSGRELSGLTVAEQYMNEDKESKTKGPAVYLKILVILAVAGYAIYVAFQDYFQTMEQLQ